MSRFEDDPLYEDEDYDVWWEDTDEEEQDLIDDTKEGDE